MKATVTWQQNLSFAGKMDSGHETLMDGEGKAISPMESVLVAAGACSSVDVVEILKKGRIELAQCQCILEAKRADSPPRVFTEIHAHYVVSGNGLTEKAVQRAVQLSAEKYCSVMLMLEKTVNITTSYEIKHPD